MRHDNKTFINTIVVVKGKFVILHEIYLNGRTLLFAPAQLRTAL